MQRVFARLLAATVAASAATIVLTAGPASAHEHRPVAGGKYQFLVGWGDEPTYTGTMNSASVTITDANDKSVNDITDTLKVQVKTGDKTADYTLEPAFEIGEFGTPGEYRAYLIPTATGTYSFHFTGTIHGDAVDETFTSSETTFDSPKDATEIEFPSKDPSTGQLAQRLDREATRVQALQPAVKKNKDSASTAKTLAIVGIALGALGLVIGGIGTLRKR